MNLLLGLLCLAKDCMNLGPFMWGASLLEEAPEVARASAYSVRNVSCIGKLYVDVQAYVGVMAWTWIFFSGNILFNDVLFSISGWPIIVSFILMN
ncbi:hypothetical protein Ahy_A09g046567 isoform A [Arachis hypogaea]|uniref:Uncharacterized protein n=1 Tax=Arachis hypogaea TaxID=3818 RepID=A0A445BQ93_ARAHY|nr:hypothetical protein Ahy_A09g046567 isoform A [Arachis hypogaea]